MAGQRQRLPGAAAPQRRGPFPFAGCPGGRACDAVGESGTQVSPSEFDAEAKSVNAVLKGLNYPDSEFLPAETRATRLADAGDTSGVTPAPS
jgi:hypothetical protein